MILSGSETWRVHRKTGISGVGNVTPSIAFLGPCRSRWNIARNFWIRRRVDRDPAGSCQGLFSGGGQFLLVGGELPGEVVVGNSARKNANTHPVDNEAFDKFKAATWQWMSHVQTALAELAENRLALHEFRYINERER